MNWWVPILVIPGLVYYFIRKLPIKLKVDVYVSVAKRLPRPFLPAIMEMNTLEVFSGEQLTGGSRNLIERTDNTDWPVKSCKVHGDKDWIVYSHKNFTGSTSVLRGGQTYLNPKEMGMPDNGSYSFN